MTQTIYQQLCDMNLLTESWLEVKTKGSDGGIDSISIDSFNENAEKHILQLLVKLKTETYNPLPLKQISIKKDIGGNRELGLLSVIDKIVQRSVKTLIEPIFETSFLDVSYGFRPKKGPVKAIRRLMHLIENLHYTWFVKIDVDNCFDTIPVDQLIEYLRKKLKDDSLVNLIEIWMKMGYVSFDKSWNNRSSGIPQGAILSPLLMNCHLHALDRYVTSKKDVGYVRYADDIVIGCNSKIEAKDLYRSTKEFLKKELKQEFNKNVQIVHIKDSFSFLGIVVKGGKISISRDKFEKLKNKIIGSFGIENRKPSKLFIERVRGIKNYYGQLLKYSDLRSLDMELIYCLKNKLSRAYSEHIMSTKKDIREFVSNVPFLSKESEIIKQRLAIEISQACTKSRKIEIKRTSPKQQVDSIIKGRKREFQKLESAGMDLIISKPGSIVGKSKSNIVVKQKGKVVASVATHNLKSITITVAGVSISSNMVKFCSDKNIGLSFLNFDGTPYGILLTPKFTQSKNVVSQIEAQLTDIGVDWAKATIKGKIKNQINTLKFFSRQRKNSDPDFMEHLPKTVSDMKESLKKLKDLDGDKISEIRDQIFAIEGRAAQLYWRQVARILDDYTVFDKRERRGATDLVNSMLNYGYAILYSKIWRAVITERLNPCIGIIHSSENTNAALVYDIIEEFRSPVIDRTVISLISKGENIEVKKGKLTEESKSRLLQRIMKKLNTIEKFRGSELHLVNIIQHQVAETRRVFTKSIPTYKPYIKTW